MQSHCAAVAPAWLCAHLDVLVYLAPSAVLAVLIYLLARAHPLFFIFTLAGTLCHELAHWLVGWLTGARPTSLTIIPRRVAVSKSAGQRSHWQLGAVTLTRVTWYNAAPAALAPLLILLLPFAVALWRTRPGWHFVPLDLAIAFALAPQFLCFWPSAPDWRIAARSWPCLVAIALALWALSSWHPGVFHLVKS